MLRGCERVHSAGGFVPPLSPAVIACPLDFRARVCVAGTVVLPDSVVTSLAISSFDDNKKLGVKYVEVPKVTGNDDVTF